MTIRGFDIIALVTGGVLESADASSPSTPVIAGTPTALDTRMLAKVVTIIERYGKTVIFSVYPDAAYDATTGVNTQGTASQYAKKVIPPYPVEDKYIDGDLIRAGDMLTGVAAQDIEFTPEPGVEVSIDSKTWKVIKSNPIYCNEKVVLYILQLRK